MSEHDPTESTMPIESWWDHHTCANHIEPFDELVASVTALQDKITYEVQAHYVHPVTRKCLTCGYTHV